MLQNHPIASGIAFAVFVFLLGVVFWAWGHRAGVRQGHALLKNFSDTQAPFSLGGRWYRVIDHDAYVADRKLVPELIQPFQADAAMAWLKKMGVTLQAQHPNTTTLDVVRTVIKAVREAQQ